MGKIRELPPGTAEAGDMIPVAKGSSLVTNRVTVASVVALAGSGSPTGAAGGDLSGSYPNPSVTDDSHSHTVATLPSTMPPSAHGHPTSDIVSGVLPIARLATGTPTGSKFIRDDGALAVPPTTPSGSAGGDLSGTYPNPSVVDDSHSHTTATLPATMAPSAHVHSGADITSGTVALARLPTIPTSQVSGLAVSATTDTTNASNITSGTLAAARVATLNQNTTGSAGSLSATNDVAHGGTGAVTLATHGLVVGNGTSAVSVTGPGTAGQVLTSNGASADPTFQSLAAYNTTPQSVTSSTTLVSSSNLVLTLAPGKYKVEFLLWFGCSVVGGFKVARGGTANVTLERWMSEVYEGSDGASVATQLEFLSLGVTGDTIYYARIVGAVEVTSGGTLLLRFAQSSSDSTATQILQGSSIVATWLAE